MHHINWDLHCNQNLQRRRDATIDIYTNILKKSFPITAAKALPVLWELYLFQVSHKTL